MLLGFRLRRVTRPNGERVYFWDAKDADAASAKEYGLSGRMLTWAELDGTGGNASDGDDTNHAIRYPDRDDSASAD
jgi:hypothetical protein